MTRPGGRLLLRLLALLPLACSGGRGVLRGGTYYKEGLRYRVAAPPPSWRQVELQENDLAFVSRTSPHSLALNSTCEGHGDAPLEVLTQHLLMGFTDKQKLEEQRQPLDGRESLRSHYLARLDGVPVELTLVVLKKDGCVFDFTYLSPPGRSEEQRKSFEALLLGFHAEARR